MLRLGVDAGAGAARQHLVELPLVISDHADWDGLTRIIAAHRRLGDLGHPRAGRCAGALERDPGLAARPLDIVGYGDEDDADAAAESGTPAPPRSLPRRRRKDREGA